LQSKEEEGYHSKIRFQKIVAKIVILLNGIPGPWIQIKRGLRQGDPLSPLLFIILVNVLQQIIKHFSIEGKLKHPIILD
jgi:hypothetical protein